MTRKEWKKVSRLLKENNRYQVYRITCDVWRSNFKLNGAYCTNKDLIEKATRTKLESIDDWLKAMNYLVQQKKT